jgi:Holliday junction resolvase RusA-like endonuclease
MKYRAFRDRVRELNIHVPAGAHITFYLPTPASWSKKLAARMQDQPHKTTPDLDNLIKALLDSVYTQDKHIWKLSAEKRWRHIPGIKIEVSK